MSGFPYLDSKGVLWSVTPPDPNAKTIIEDGVTMVPLWHGLLVSDAYTKRAGFAVSATGLDEAKAGIEAFIVDQDPKAAPASEAPKIPVKSSGDGGGMLWLIVLGAFYIANRKARR